MPQPERCAHDTRVAIVGSDTYAQVCCVCHRLLTPADLMSETLWQIAKAYARVEAADTTSGMAAATADLMTLVREVYYDHEIDLVPEA